MINYVATLTVLVSDKHGDREVTMNIETEDMHEMCDKIREYSHIDTVYSVVRYQIRDAYRNSCGIVNTILEYDCDSSDADKFYDFINDSY